MKHIIKYILPTSFALLSLAMSAQAAGQSDDKDMVKAAFREVAAEDVITPITTIDMEELAAKSYNTSALANLNSLIPGWNGSSMWGMDTSKKGYLLLVDGVPRKVGNISQDEIKSVTFMKGASAVVLYGSRAAKGVVLITTKRGKVEDMSVTVNANTGYYVAKGYPSYVGTAEYMVLYNEASANDGLSTIPYSEDDIINAHSGINKYKYPDLNFYSPDYINNFYNRTQASAEITGGTEAARYYTNIGYTRTGDYLNFGEAADNGSNRLTVRGNVDFKVASFLDAYVNASTALYDSRSAKGNFWSSANTIRPNRLTPLIPVDMISPDATDALGMMAVNGNLIDGKYFFGGSNLEQTNIFADYYAAGHNKNIERSFEFNTGLNFDLGMITKGLRLKADFAMDYESGYKVSYTDSYAVYSPTWSEDADGNQVITSLEKFGEDKHSGKQSVGDGSVRRTSSFNAHFDYDRSFGDHTISAMALANAYQFSETGIYHKESYTNLGFQATYNYKQKYYIDLAGAMVYSTKLAKGNRSKFSPSVTVGWNAANEEFLKGSFVNNLTLSASSSILNTDTYIDGYYLYKASYTSATGNGAFTWADGSSVGQTYANYGGNPNLTYIQRQEQSVSLKFGLWDNTITGEVSGFNNSIAGQLISAKNMFPSYFVYSSPSGSLVPNVNHDRTDARGVEFALNYNTQIDEVGLSVGVVGMHSRQYYGVRDELNNYEYQNREGGRTDAIWGQKCLGFFSDEEDVENSVAQKFGSAVIKPGDLKYFDKNEDDVINTDDVHCIGYSSPDFEYGANLTVKWHGLTLYAILDGSIGGVGSKSGSYYRPSGSDKYSTLARDRWTPATAATATLPRLTTTDATNNDRVSDFWFYNKTRLDLAKVQLTYDLPSTLFSDRSIVKGASAYVAGYNLLTIAEEKDFFETSVGSAPYSRFVNLGVKVTF